MINFENKLKSFLHDPIDKCFHIPTHIERAKKYARKLGVSGIEDAVGSDIIASCMERSLLPKGIIQNFNEIRHPLSNGRLELSGYDKNNIFEEICKIFENIGSDISTYNNKRKFLYLWRNLQDKIFNELMNNEWVKFLSILPADTRIPDHSIWEHLKISSAINAFWDKENREIYQNNSLFLLSLGPVQSFIIQARKTQDFYMGSFLLSYLTFIGMIEIIENFGPTSIIFPDLYKQPLMDWYLKTKLNIEPVGFNEKMLLIATIPNRFVAIIPQTKKAEIESLANKIKKNIKNEIEKIKNTLLQELNIYLTAEQKIKFDSHLDEFPQIFWVAIPWRKKNKDIIVDDLKYFLDDISVDEFRELIDFAKVNGEFPPNIGFLYPLIYTALEKALGTRKNLRKFSQNPEAGIKCFVCGERNVLFFRDKDNPRRYRHNIPNVDLTEIPISQKFLADGEGLCGLCFVKRVFEKYLTKEIGDIFNNITFPSTAEVACSKFKEKAFTVAKSEFEKFENEFTRQIGNQEVNPLPKLQTLGIKKTLEGHWFYEENLRKEEIEKSFDIVPSLKTIEEIKKKLKQLKEKVGEPSSYYAVIKLDGDNMGKWLSGELLPHIEYSYNSIVWNNLPEDFKSNLKSIKNNKIITPAIHASISTALRNFAIEFVQQIVEKEHYGKLVYAGGDDVLAFVNIEDLFDVMQKLRAAFSGNIVFNKHDMITASWENKEGFVKKDGRFLLTMGNNATASIGIVIAHYKAPLQIVLQKASYALDRAKDINGKNAFCIILMKRAGEERISVLKWHYKTEDGTFDTVQRLKEIYNFMNEKNKKDLGYFSDIFIYNLQNEFSRLKTKEDTIHPDWFTYELYRLLIRAYNGPLRSKEKSEFAKKFRAVLKEIFEHCKFTDFVNLLLIINFLISESKKLKGV